MASIIANLAMPIFIHEAKSSLKPISKFPFCGTPRRQSRVAIATKATGDSSESSTSLSIVKSVQDVLDKPEDRIGVIGLGLATVIALWASSNLISAIDKLPLIPSFLEFIGILFSSWFIYRYLLFKPNREEFFQIINKWISDILGQ
uniref:Cyanobacterial aminoacyl-tRNA synthetase CAAD domain-containing protein n=1 Tax=Opuntia streptacantha TaxID=393608 RepID=A0A7C9CJN5_OPUST